MNMNGRILTLPFARIAMPVEAVSHAGGGTWRFGMSVPLRLIAVRTGPYRIAGVTAETGALVVICGAEAFYEGNPSCRADGMSFAGAAAEELARDLSGAIVLDSAHYVEAARLFDRLFGGFEGMEDGEASALAYALFCQIASPPTQLPDDGPPGQALARVAAGEMRAHFAEIYGVSELAERLDVSVGHLIRSFRAAYGMSPGRFLADLRIAYAKKLLANRELSLEMVAGLCGFSGANYFCKAFKSQVGVTPTSWRQGAVADSDAWDERVESLYL